MSATKTRLDLAFRELKKSVNGDLDGLDGLALVRVLRGDFGLPAALEEQRLLRPARAAEFLGCSRSHLYRLVQQGRLPPPVRISHGVSGWKVAELLALMDRGRDEK